MPHELTKLAPHVERARTTLTQTAEHERVLVQALSAEMKCLDQQTLQGVRTVAAEHEARRAGILDELQALADSIGTFRPQHERAPLESVATPRPLPQPVAIPQPLARPQPTAVGIPDQIDYGHQYGPADWRQATKNVSLQDDLEALLNGLNGKGSKT